MSWLSIFSYTHNNINLKLFGENTPEWIFLLDINLRLSCKIGSMTEKKYYSIKELADLAKVSTRTLRFYDQRGLLKPAKIGNNGYRYYDKDNFIRLQQILFFREMDLPLKEINSILQNPTFNTIDALRTHRRSLENKIKRLAKLMNTIDTTIANLQGETNMENKDYFEGFDETKYEEEVKERWGDSPRYAESQKKWKIYSKEEKEKIKALGGKITLAMVGKDSDTQPEDPKVQSAIREYHQYLNQYFYTCDVEFLRNLADMWVQDERFAVNYNNIREGGAEFVRKSVHIFCDNNSE